MTEIQRIKNLEVPQGKIDAVLDTDAYNEVDDQFAISYMLKSGDRINTKAIYAAPFSNMKSKGPGDGMERSYDEIIKLLEFGEMKADVYKGSTSYLPDEKTPVISDAANHLAKLADTYSPENPLYVVSIGAITNVASAILINPRVAQNCVVVWLGGHAQHYVHTREFNMMQDVAAARVVMGSKVPFVQLPCGGVVTEFRISRPELEYWLCGKNKLADYLAKNAIEEAERYASGKPWTRVIWDVTAVAWLINDGDRFMKSCLVSTPMPSYDNLYSQRHDAHLMRYVYQIERDALMDDLIKKLI